MYHRKKDVSVPFVGMRIRKGLKTVYLVALMPDGRTKAIGRYRTYARAQAILREVLINEQEGSRRVYYLPVA